MPAETTIVHASGISSCEIAVKRAGSFRTRGTTGEAFGCVSYLSVVDQSSESYRLHGPYAVCAPGVTSRVDEPLAIDMEWLDSFEPAPSSNGPAALRGDALVLALAALR